MNKIIINIKKFRFVLLLSLLQIFFGNLLISQTPDILRRVILSRTVNNYSAYYDENSKQLYWTRLVGQGQEDTTDNQFFADNVSIYSIGEIYRENGLEISGLPEQFKSIGNIKLSLDGSSAVFSATTIEQDTLWYILTAKKDNGNWTFDELVYQSYNWTSHPCYYSNNNQILFSSVGPVGAVNYGKSDIYVIEKNADGIWNNPINLGNQVNSPFEDLSPYYTEKNGIERLFYSSNRTGGMGGLDLYSIDFDEENKVWVRNRSMTEYNSTFDDAFYFETVNSDNVILFSSNRLGSWQIYGKLKEYIKKEFIASGTIMNARTKEIIPGAEIIIKEVNIGSKTPFYQKLLDDTTGKYNIEIIEKDREIDISANSTDIFFQSLKIKITDKDTIMILKPDTNCKFALELEKDREFDIIAQSSESDLFFDTYNIRVPVDDTTQIIEFFFNVSEKLTLRINFPTNSWRDPYEFTVDSNGTETTTRWTRVMEILAENIELSKDKLDKLELVGHTDDVGTTEFNYRLGQNRVNFIISELVKRGVDRNILTGISEGEMSPLPRRENEDIENYRKRLRRVELRKVLEHEDKEK